jgi:ABC-type Fe3+ transport system permease subunit
VRIGLPGLIAGVGIIVVFTGPSALGYTLIGIAALVVLADFFVRLAIASNLDREREGRARGIFARTGHWPDEAG